MQVRQSQKATLEWRGKSVSNTVVPFTVLTGYLFVFCCVCVLYLYLCYRYLGQGVRQIRTQFDKPYDTNAEVSFSEGSKSYIFIHFPKTTLTIA